eukprot:gene3175-13189_t
MYVPPHQVSALMHLYCTALYCVHSLFYVPLHQVSALMPSIHVCTSLPLVTQAVHAHPDIRHGQTDAKNSVVPSSGPRFQREKVKSSVVPSTGPRFQRKNAKSSILPSSGPRFQREHWKVTPSEEVLLTKRITQVTRVVQLQTLVAESAPSFNDIHLTAVFSRLARFSRHSGDSLDSRDARILYIHLLPKLIALLRHYLDCDSLSPQSLATIINSLAAMEVQDAELVAELAHVAEPRLYEFTTQGQAMLVWGFAKLNHRPPSQWVSSFLNVLLARIGECQPQEVAVVLWSLAKLRYKLGGAKLAEILDHVQPRLAQYNAHSLSMIAYSLACFEHVAESAWLEAFVSELTGPKLTAFTNQGLTQTLWALGRMGYLADSPFCSTISATVHRQLQRYNTADLATVLQAFADLGITPPAELAEALQHATYRNMWSMSAYNVSAVSFSFAKMRAVPEQGWLRRMLSVVYSHLPTFKPKELVMTVGALARFNVRPPPEFMVAFRARLDVMAGELSPQEIAHVIWSLARFGYKPSRSLLAEFFMATNNRSLLAEFFMATNNRLYSFKPKELSHMIWALAGAGSLSLTPDPTWLEEFLDTSYNVMFEFSPSGLSNIVSALARLRVTPPPAWTSCYAAACRKLLEEGGLGVTQLGSIIEGLELWNVTLQTQQSEVMESGLGVMPWDHLEGLGLWEIYPSKHNRWE